MFSLSRFSSAALAAVLVSVGFFISASFAFAAINVTDITADGASSVTVPSGATISVAVTATLGGAGNDDWHGTSYRFELGGYTCVNTDNHNSGTPTESFTVVAPSAAGTYDLDIRIHENSNCTGSNDSGSLNNGVTVYQKSITSATVDGGSSTTVAPGADISTVVNVTATGIGDGNDWSSTQWRLSTSDAGAMTCTNTAPDSNVAGDFTSNPFTITAPLTPGVYNLYLVAREGFFIAFCTGSASPLYTLANAVTVKTAQTITFAALSDMTYGAADFDVSATSDSSLTVTFAAAGSCTMADANTVHLTGSGNCTITASQAGDSTYAAAADVDRSFSIAQKELTITGLTANDKVYDGTATATLAGGTLSGVVGSDDVSLDNSAVVAAFSDEDVIGVQSVSVSGYALVGAAISNYTLTQPAGLTAEITAKPLTIVATGVNKVFDGTDFAVVTLTTANPNDVIVGDDVTFSYASATFASTDVGAGIAVSVDGIALGGADMTNYSLVNTTANTTASITQDVGTITLDTTTLTFVYDGVTSRSVPVLSTDPSGLAYVVTYDGSTVEPINAGTYTVFAAITDNNYAGTSNTTLTITKADQTIAPFTIADKTFGDVDFVVSATSDSGLTVAFAVTGNCILIGADTIHITGEGSCTVTASQSGDSNYNAAASVQATFAIAAGTFTSSTVVVTPMNLETADVATAKTNTSGLWFFYNDENDTINNTLGSLVLGTTTPPAGVGSAQVSVTGTERRNLATYRFAGTKLADITELKFSTFNPSAGNGGSATRSAFLTFNVDFDGTDTWQRRISYVPSQNEVVTQNTWQEWDAIKGGTAQYSHSGSTWPGTATPGSTLKTWNEILALYPDVRMRVTDGWLGLRVGEPYADGYTEYMDKFVFATGSTETVFDFEPDTGAPVITLLGSATMNLTVGDTFTDPGATAQDAVDGDITSSIVVTGTVDTATAGTYEVKYNVTDAASNAATEVIRTIVVAAAPTNNGGGGGGGGGGAGLIPGILQINNNPAPAPAPASDGGQVLGASTFRFNVNFGFGSKIADVRELQTVLIASGHLKIAQPTGYFGPLTRAAVRAYQTTHSVKPVTGYVGPKTRAVLNGDAVVDPNVALLEQLQKQLADLLKQQLGQ